MIYRKGYTPLDRIRVCLQHNSLGRHLLEQPLSKDFCLQESAKTNQIHPERFIINLILYMLLSHGIDFMQCLWTRIPC